MSKSCAECFLFYCNVSISHTGGREAGRLVQSGGSWYGPRPLLPTSMEGRGLVAQRPRCGKQEVGSGSAAWARGPRRRSAVETVSGRARARLRRPTENILKLAKRISGPARLLGSLGWRRPGAAGKDRAALLSRTGPQTFSPLMSRAARIYDRGVGGAATHSVCRQRALCSRTQPFGNVGRSEGG